MNFTGKPIPLPLEPGINRCLGHGHNKGEWCEKLATCAAHQTISHDAQVFAPVAYRKCMTDNFAAYLPIDGFPVEYGEELSTVAAAFGLDPATLTSAKAVTP
jgi:hypothetical protein